MADSTVPHALSRDLGSKPRLRLWCRRFADVDVSGRKENANDASWMPAVLLFAEGGVARGAMSAQMQWLLQGMRTSVDAYGPPITVSLIHCSSSSHYARRLSARSDYQLAIFSDMSVR